MSYCGVPMVTLRIEPLTNRQQQLLELIVQGRTNREIAQIWGRTTRTIEYHRNILMRKFNARTSADMVRRAIVGGFVPERVILNGIV